MTKGARMLTTGNEEEPQCDWNSIFIAALCWLLVTFGLSNAILYVLSSFKITETITEFPGSVSEDIICLVSWSKVLIWVRYQPSLLITMADSYLNKLNILLSQHFSFLVEIGTWSIMNKTASTITHLIIEGCNLCKMARNSFEQA